ncbi:hypothetical protein LUZ61_003017 [Rhynchospora tenuis]|uniref:Uncharacterized protein n=1 Tax=Rhynchospora tenuis TaxID=198213 RepID=A0AAD6ESA4_9POAL|nr:hypothetical protein LUZ61_003017 [Rhynchospora tenuis]
MHYPKTNELGQPSHVVVPPPVVGTPIQFSAAGQWTTGLCSCFDDCSSCCLTLWCPCVTFGRIAHMTDRGLTSCCGSASLCCFLCLCVGFHWIYTCIYRRNLRMLYNLPESPCCDCCVEYCCECCSLCQMYRELQNRGFNMSLGFHQNLERLGQATQATMQPPQVPSGMYM